MPGPLAHTFAGFLFYPETKKYLFQNKVYAASFIVLFANFPDYDFLIGWGMGDLLWCHRLFTHTLLFPILAGGIIGIAARLCRKNFLPFFTISASLIVLHIVLDYFCFDHEPINGIGVPLLWPFSTDYFYFPFHPFVERFMGDNFGVTFVLINDLYYCVIFFGLMVLRKKVTVQVATKAPRHKE